MDKIWEGPNIQKNGNRYLGYYNLQVCKDDIPEEFKEIRASLPSNEFKCYRLKSDNDLYLFTWIRKLTDEDLKFYKKKQIDLKVDSQYLYEYASNLSRGIIWENKKKREDSWKKWYQVYQDQLKKNKQRQTDFIKKTNQLELKYQNKLLPFQIEHTKKLVQSIKLYHRAIDASDTGTGKTYVALAICRELNLTPVIVCPLSVIPSWEQALTYFGWTDGSYYLSNYEQYRTNNVSILEQLDINTTKCVKWLEDNDCHDPPKYIYRWTLDPHSHMVIFDECHKVKNMTTYNYSMFWWAVKQGLKMLGLSATMADKLINVFPVSYMLGLVNNLSDFKNKYMRDIDLSYFGKEIDEDGIMRFNMRYKEDLRYFESSDYNLHNLHRDIFPEHGSRMVINDLGDMFPDNLVEAQTYKMTSYKEIQKAYEILQISIIKNKIVTQQNKYDKLLNSEYEVSSDKLSKLQAEIDVLQNKYRKLTGKTIENNLDDDLLNHIPNSNYLVLDTKNKSKYIGESRDKNIGESRDKNIGESRDKNIGESRDKNIGESRDECVGESRDECVGESRDKNIGESRDELDDDDEYHGYLSQRSGVSILKEIMLARQKIELLKTETFFKMAHQFYEEGKSVVIFVNFRNTLNKLEDMFKQKKISISTMFGASTSLQKLQIKANVKAFQDNKHRIMICTIQTGGIGISLHDLHGGHPRVSIISTGWSAQDLVQALGRIHRAKGKSKCLQYIVFCADTIEDDICVKVRDKIKTINMLNDGDLTGMINI